MHELHWQVQQKQKSHRHSTFKLNQNKQLFSKSFSSPSTLANVSESGPVISLILLKITLHATHYKVKT